MGSVLDPTFSGLIFMCHMLNFDTLVSIYIYKENFGNLLRVKRSHIGHLKPLHLYR